MILDFAELEIPIAHDACVVGSGPIGLALALSLAERGLKVLVLESGLLKPTEFHIKLGDGNIRNPANHTSLTEACCRALGGTSHWWGGRCLPFDPVDFEPRPDYTSSSWPIRYDEVARWYPAAAKFFGCGPAEFDFPTEWNDLSGVRFDQVERWCPNPNMASVHRGQIEQSSDIIVVTGATVVDLVLAADRRTVTSLMVAGVERREQIASPLVVLACGGVQTPRLLLTVQRQQPTLFGGVDGPLGRYYMGHNFGKIAELLLDRPAEGKRLDYFVDRGTHIRRRFTLPADVTVQHRLPNVSFAVGNARLSDPTHRSGVLSLLWLCLASPLGKRLLPDALLRIYVGGGPHPYAAHIRNILLSLPSTLLAGISVYREKYVRKPGKPSIFLFSAGGRYSLHYHAEQMPEAENRIRLCDELDAFGVPRADITFRYSREDAERIVRAHEMLADAVRASRIGRIEFNQSREDAIASVMEQARDGMHQIGAARMSIEPADGVVNADCRVHDMENLYVASSCVFPTSGNANPTFLGVALALRLADHLASTAGRSFHPTMRSRELSDDNGNFTRPQNGAAQE